MQSQSHGRSETSKSCSDNDDIELEWLGHPATAVVIVAGFMRSVFAMSVLQKFEAVGGIGSILSQRQRSYFSTAFLILAYLNRRSARMLESRLRHVESGGSGVGAYSHNVYVGCALQICVPRFAGRCSNAWMFARKRVDKFG